MCIVYCDGEPTLNALRLMVVVLQVRGTCELDTRAQQVQEEAGSLNSDDVFVLETPGKTYLWIGKVRIKDSLNIVILFSALMLLMGCTINQCQ